MQKSSNMVYKTLVVGVIVLFIGVGIQPAFAVTPNISDSEDDCNLCPKVSNQNIVKIKNLLFRLETLIDELSDTSKQNPFVEEKYQEFTKRFSIVKEIYKGYMLYWDFPIICPLLFILQLSLIALEFYSWYFGGRFDLPLVNVMIEITDVLGYKLGCPWYVHPP